jgi:hypothetical protein
VVTIRSDSSSNVPKVVTIRSDSRPLAA